MFPLRGSKPRSFRTSEVTVKRTLGTILPETATVDAGGTADFAITYTFTEDMPTGLIEVRLPVGWADGLPPRVFTYDDRPTTADEKKDIATSEGIKVTSGYVHLGRIRVTAMADDPDRIRYGFRGLDADAGTPTIVCRASIYRGTMLSNMEDGWIIPVFVSGAKKGNKIVLHYNGGRAQRVMTTKDNEAIIAIHAVPVDGNLTADRC